MPAASPEDLLPPDWQPLYAPRCPGVLGPGRPGDWAFRSPVSPVLANWQPLALGTQPPPRHQWARPPSAPLWGPLGYRGWSDRWAQPGDPEELREPAALPARWTVARQRHPQRSSAAAARPQRLRAAPRSPVDPSSGAHEAAKSRPPRRRPGVSACRLQMPRGVQLGSFTHSPRRGNLNLTWRGRYSVWGPESSRETLGSRP